MKKASMIVIAVALCAVAAAVLLWPRGNSQTEQNPVSSAQSTEENSHAPGGETQGGEDTPGGQETSEGELPLVTAPSPVQDAPAQGEAGGGQENEPAPVTGSAAPASTPAPAPTSAPGAAPTSAPAPASSQTPAPGAGGGTSSQPPEQSGGGSAAESGVIELPFVPAE